MRRKVLVDVESSWTKSGYDKFTGFPADWVDGVRRKGGAIFIQASLWNYGKPIFAAKACGQGLKLKVQRVDTKMGGGPSYTSAEASVMEVEQRGRAMLQFSLRELVRGGRP